MKLRVPTCFSKTIREEQIFGAGGAVGLDFKQKGDSVGAIPFLSKPSYVSLPISIYLSQAQFPLPWQTNPYVPGF
jgi:hypothetical protein